MMQRKKYVWLTDTHIKILGRYKLLNTILEQNPFGVFLTGDISEGFSFLSDLKFLGERIGRPLYFVHGNHELWGSSFEKVHDGIRNLCLQYKNLIWMTDAGIVPLNDKTCIIGNSGWYDIRVGNPKYIKFTFDWWAIKDFRQLPTMKDRIEKMREIADADTEIIAKKLEEALDTYKTVYLLSHVPAWREAHRAHGWISDKFYEPYNTNIFLGQKLEEVMKKHKKRHLICLMGHTHCAVSIHVSRNIECRVGRGSYRKILEEEIFYI